MEIAGIAGLSPSELREELRRGGRFVVYAWCVSVLVLTFRRSSDVTFVRAEESAVVKGLGWTALTFFAGWWGFPWGLIYTPMALAQNLGGGKDVTPQVVQALGLEDVAVAPPPDQPAAPSLARFENVVPPSPRDPDPLGTPAPRPVNPDAARAADQLGGWALGTGVPGLCCFPLGLAAIVLGVLGFSKAKDAGRPAPATATVGVVLGVLGLLLQGGAFAVGKLAPSLSQADGGVSAPRATTPKKSSAPSAKAPATTPSTPPPLTPAAASSPSSATTPEPAPPKKGSRLELDITRVHWAQKPLEVPPFHAKGGDWTFLELSPRTDPTAKALVGLKSAKAKRGDESGNVLLVASDPASGGRFLEAFAAALQVDAPKARANPTKLAPFPVFGDVLARDVVRDERGRFGEAKGAWTTTRWTLDRQGVGGVLLFNYALLGMHAELVEAYAGYTEDATLLLAEALRDGPRPPRTPANDPTLAKDGPRFVDLVKVSSDDRSWIDRDVVYYLPDGPGGEVLRRFDSKTRKSVEVSRFEGRVVQLEASGRLLLVVEALPGREDVESTEDPRRVWLLDGRSKRQLTAPEPWEHPDLLSRSLSPDGRLAAFGRWEPNAERGSHRSLLVLDLVDGSVQRLARGDSSFDVVDWERRPSGWVLHVQRGLVIEEAKEQAAFDYELATNTLVPVTRPLTLGEEVATTSPDGKTTVSTADGGVVFTDVATGAKRVMTLHPDDARFADEGAFSWVSPRYLSFEPNGRVALVDAKTRTLWFPLPQDEQPVLRYTADFKTVVKATDDGLYLGRVVSP